MITYELSLDRQNLLGADNFTIVADSNKTIQLRFHFDRSWRIFDTKAAVFKSSRGKYYVLDIKSNCVIVPWELLRDISGFELAVVAYEKCAVQTSKKVRITVASSLLPEFCKQLSPTETIFDRFKTEARNEAYLDCKDEIRALKRSYEKEVLKLNERIAEKTENLENITALKNAEIARLNYEASCVENNHRLEIAQMQSELAICSEKAHYWDLIDTAIKDKSTFAHAPWVGGSQPYELPPLYFDSLSTLGNTKISSYLNKFEISIPKITQIVSTFSSLPNLQEIILHDTDKIETLSSTFSGCSSLKSVKFDNLQKCKSIKYIFNNCRALEYIEVGEMYSLTNILHAFDNCNSLSVINGTLHTQSCTDFSGTFNCCNSLKTIRFAQNSINRDIDFGYSVNLSKESIFSIANALNSLTPANVAFSENAFNTNLTASERAEVSNLIRNIKGWTLSMA